MTHHETRTVLEQIDYLAEAWPDLVTLGIAASDSGPRLLPTRRRRSDAAVERAQQEALAIAFERSQAGWVEVRSHSSTPVDVDMLDLLAAFVSAAEQLGETVTQVAGVDRPSAVVSAWEDPRPRLLTARAWLTAAQEADASTVPWAAGVLAPVVRETARMLGEIVDGQVLDALCPWCDGRSERRPTGGDRTLVVHAARLAITTAPRRVTPGLGTGDEGPWIVCHGTSCTPPPDACGAQRKGQPAWPEREWDWLAKHLVAIDEPAQSAEVVSLPDAVHDVVAVLAGMLEAP